MGSGVAAGSCDSASASEAGTGEVQVHTESAGPEAAPGVAVSKSAHASSVSCEQEAPLLPPLGVGVGFVVKDKC